MDRKDLAEKRLTQVSPPPFTNPDHQQRLKARLMAQLTGAAEGREGIGFMSSIIRTIRNHRWIAGTSVAAAATATVAVAFLLTVTTTSPGCVFTEAIGVFKKYPVVHYLLKKRAIREQWGPIIDPRLPLIDDDQVWVHRDREGNVLAIRYESGRRTGNRGIILFKGETAVFYRPKNRWATKFPINADRIREIGQLGPLYILKQAEDLDQRKVKTVKRGDNIVATAYVEAKPIAGDRKVPIHLHEFDTRRVFVFDARSKFLRSLTVEGRWKGRWIVLLQIEQVHYLKYDRSLFELDLPDDVAWGEQPQAVDTRAHKSTLATSPEQVTRAFFNAWINEDYATVRLYAPAFPAVLKRLKKEKNFSPVKILSVGQAYRPADGIFPGVFVPYEVRFAGGSIKKFRLALKKRKDGSTWYVSGGI